MTGVLQLEEVAHLADGPERRVQHVFGVGGRDAEAGPGLDDGRGGEAHHHHADVPLQHLPPERPDFGGHVEHHGHHGGVVVAVEDEAHLLESPPEIRGVLSQLQHPIVT